MSKPRRIVPGRTLLITRRTSERRFFMRPSEKVAQICEYCLGIAAERYKIIVHKYQYPSNHYHLVVTDTEGLLPEFMRWHNEFLAKCLNAELGRWESLWAPGSYSEVELTDPASILAEMEYTNNNVVRAGLVPSAKQWPGARSLPTDLNGPPKKIARPQGFFRENGPLPEFATLGVSMPEGLDMTVEEFDAHVQRKEREIHEQFRREGREFLGVDRVLAEDPNDSPSTPAPRRKLNPRVAGKDKGLRIEALQRLKQFLADYKKALERFVAGERDVVFPYGTYGMRVRYAVMCNGP